MQQRQVCLHCSRCLTAPVWLFHCRKSKIRSSGLITENHSENHVQYPTCPVIFKLIMSRELPLISVKKDINMEEMCRTGIFSYGTMSLEIVRSRCPHFQKKNRRTLEKFVHLKCLTFNPLFDFFLIFSTKDWPY